MAAGLEREVKLRFADAAAARAAVLRSGAAPLRARRLQQDSLLDTAEGLLRGRRSVLRVRAENGTAIVTFKGPVIAGTMKTREEIETSAGDPGALLAILEHAGFRVWFRYEKFREEFIAHDVIVAVDETPVGTFIEVEGSEAGVAACVRTLGRSPTDYILESYRALFIRACEDRGVDAGDMLFDRA